MVDMCCRIQKIPNALARPGTMIACSVSTQPSWLMIRYCGITLSCAGTVMVSSTMRNSVFRPGNVSFANAKPAMAQSTADSTATVVDTSTLLSSDSMNGTVSNTFPATSRKFVPGNRRGGIEVTAVAPTEATTSM
ncbi:hypothetical protein [Clavibacter tessellarius]|uniref:hypothetical protein n=1 Tax=Clavibacter tessellarius TaxID=31965 RepID=UPI0032512312